MQMSAFKKSRRIVTWDCQGPCKCQECKMCSLMAFGSRIECHASKNNLFDHWEQRSITLTSLRSKS